jgi:hypothetical protein
LQSSILYNKNARHTRKKSNFEAALFMKIISTIFLSTILIIAFLIFLVFAIFCIAISIIFTLSIAICRLVIVHITLSHVHSLLNNYFAQRGQKYYWNYLLQTENILALMCLIASSQTGTSVS